MRQSIEKVILEMVKKKSGIDGCDINIPVKNLGLDSIEYIELIVEIEEYFEIEMGEEILAIESFEHLLDLIEYVVGRKEEAILCQIS